MQEFRDYGGMREGLQQKKSELIWRLGALRRWEAELANRDQLVKPRKRKSLTRTLNMEERTSLLIQTTQRLLRQVEHALQRLEP